LSIGALIALIGLIALYLQSGANTFDIPKIIEHAKANPLAVNAQISSSRCCCSDSAFWFRSGRSIRGRRWATAQRRRRPPCCMPGVLKNSALRFDSYCAAADRRRPPIVG